MYFADVLKHMIIIRKVIEKGEWIYKEQFQIASEIMKRRHSFYFIRTVKSFLPLETQTVIS